MFNKENFGNFVKKSIDFEETEQTKYLEKNTRSEILLFQEEKKKIILKMHELLKLADDGEEISFGEKDLISIGFDGENYKTFGSREGIVTKGDIAVASI